MWWQCTPLWSGKVGKSVACRVSPVPPRALRWAPVIELKAILGIAQVLAALVLVAWLSATSVHVLFPHQHWPEYDHGGQ